MSHRHTVGSVKPQSKTPSFREHIQAEKLQAQEARSRYVSRKLIFATALLGLGSVSIVNLSAAFLLSATILPLEGKILLLLGLPISLAWYLRTTINHALSFEDLLRRIGEIEERVNALVGERLLAFQSTHPNRDRVGGRTGTGAVQSVFLACGLILAGCLVLVQSLADLAGASYNVYVLAVVLYLAGLMATFHRYRYRRKVISPETV